MKSRIVDTITRNEIIRDGVKYIFRDSLLAPLLKKALGSTLHQKILMCPQIGYWPNIKNPQTFNEKIMHRKLFTDKKIFSEVEDKWEVRKYVKEKLGDNILKEIYHVTDDPETIPFNELPDKIVIKPTHLSGPVLFIDGIPDYNKEHIKKRCRDWLSETYGEVKGEYWYSQIEPKIMIEEFLHDEEYEIPLDYKFFVFHGQVEYIEVDFDRFSEHSRRFYDRDWNPQNFTLKYPLGPKMDEPERLDDMIEIAEALGEDFDFIRVDLYQPNGEIFFGELTVAHGSGGERFVPQEYDFEFGLYWSNDEYSKSKL